LAVRLSERVPNPGGDLVRVGHLRVIIESVFSLEEAARAHQILEDRAHFGKVLLVPQA
jgi:NADPH:quinone reductase-like Zn-dependent oxidoreductase